MIDHISFGVAIDVPVIDLYGADVIVKLCLELFFCLVQHRVADGKSALIDYLNVDDCFVERLSVYMFDIEV